jgi:MFS family permease
MREALLACWPLLVGIGLMMLGNGLQGSLLGVRAGLEGFPTAITGLIMSGYYVGFLVGSFVTPKILGSVGHVRVFAALASLASTAALIHAVLPDPYVWGVFRIVAGFCFAGLYIVSESWLNDAATNETRGQILSIYMVVTFGGIAGGQFLLTVADPGGFNLFIIVSVLVSLALIPSALTASPMPNMEAPEKLGIRKLFRISQLGVVGIVIVGVIHGGFFAIAAVYGGLFGLSLPQISLFISLVVVGGALMQFPIGRASDLLDRRLVLLLTAGAAAGCSLLVFYTESTGNVWFFMVAVALFGGFSMPLYSLCIAHTNDHLAPGQMVAASSGLILVNGAGAVAGPIIVSSLMGVAGYSAFFIFMAGACFCIVLFTLYRMIVRDAAPLEDQSDFVAMPVRSGLIAVNMNPEADWDESEDEDNGTYRMLSKASMAILAEYGDDDDDEDDLMDDGPSLWNRNG